jgi:hypothetical protein
MTDFRRFLSIGLTIGVVVSVFGGAYAAAKKKAPAKPPVKACTTAPAEKIECTLGKPAPKGAVKLVGLDGWKAQRGADLGKWTEVGEVSLDDKNNRKLTTKKGKGIIDNGGRTKNILSKEEFGDIEAHIEFMVSKGSNSGVYFQGRYEIQVLDSWGVKKLKHGDCGGIYQRWGKNPSGKMGYEGVRPRVNASKKPG